MTRGEAARFRLCRGNTVVRDEQRRPYHDYVESFYLLERECVDAMLGRGTLIRTASEHLKTLTSTFAAYAARDSGAVIDVAAFAGGLS